MKEFFWVLLACLVVQILLYSTIVKADFICCDHTGENSCFTSDFKQKYYICIKKDEMELI